jgi:Rrf2 family protein
MKLSKKTKYALQAMGILAREYGKGPLQIANLAARERIPRKFLETILLSLRNRGILQSRKGKGGGYLLNKPPLEIGIGGIVRIFEGSLAPVPCVAAAPARKCDECRELAACGIRLVMKDAHDALANVLDATTLADMLDREDSARRKKQDILTFEI